MSNERTMEIAGAGALALLVIGGAVIAIRRRRYENEGWTSEESLQHPEPVAGEEQPIMHEEQPAIVAPAASAFAWGNEPRADEPQVDRAAKSDDEDDRRPGETWVERAYRGPSPGNPSVSLKARLKRAAFFDKREREVAAGTAEPVDADAGLPEAMVDEQEDAFA